eukprot:gene45944-57279_t
MQNGPQLSPRPEMFSAKGAADQLTASLRALPALNFGWFDAAMVIVSPVRGLRPVDALRLLTAADGISDYAAIGLVRIKEKRADRALVLDDSYIPPVLDVSAQPMLRSIGC